jgi:hypothetical protein
MSIDEYLVQRVRDFKVDNHNQHTYDYSKGYQKCLFDILQFIQKEENSNGTRSI